MIAIRVQTIKGLLIIVNIQTSPKQQILTFNLSFINMVLILKWIIAKIILISA